MEAKSKRRRQARSASEWQALLAQFKTSGLSSAAFCRHHDIGDRPFHRWRTHLSHQEETPSDPASAAPAFVDLGPLTAESPREPRIELRLDLGAGLTLTLVRA